MYKKNLILLIALILIYMTTACNSTPTNVSAVQKPEKSNAAGLPDEAQAIQLSDKIVEDFNYEKIAESDVLELGFDKKNNCLQVKDKRNGFVWESVVNARKAGLGVNSTWEQNLASMFNVTYTLKNNKGQERILGASTRKQKPYIWVNTLKNGISLQYYFESKKIGFQVELVLEGDVLKVRIPASGIREDGDTKLVSIEVLPIFGSTPNGTEGYILTPDSSGGLIDLKNVSRQGAVYRWQVYSPDQINMNPDSKLMSGSEAYSSRNEMVSEAMLPVYGIKNQQNAFLSFATEGESDYNINLSTSGFGVDLNRICGEFIFRHSYEVKGSDIKTDGSSTGQALYLKIDDPIIDVDRSVHYVFLAGENADYSGMANAYRGYLLDAHKLNRVRDDKKSVPLSVELLMGVEEKRMMSNKFIAMTRFDEAERIARKLEEGDVKDLLLNLKGWNKHGYGAYPVNAPADGNLGGDKALKEFSRYCENSGYKLTVETNFADAKKQYAGISIRSGLVKDGNGFAVTDINKERYLLNPLEAVKRFDDFRSYMKTMKLPGICVDRLGSLIYMDYGNSVPLFRNETVAQWKKIMESAKKEFENVRVRGGNLYSLEYADLLYEIPSGGSKSLLTDEEIPFYQMVVHGSIPYTSSPVNLYYDQAYQKLKNLEYGCIPHFELTYGEVYQLQNTEYNKLFSSYYGQWLEKAVKLYQEYNEELLPMMNSPMTKHERLSPNLVKIKYANGCILYINYAEKEETADGVTVKPMNYLLVKGEGSEQE